MTRKIKYIKLLFPLISLILIIGCKGEKLDCQWTNQPIEVDGLMTDWADLPKMYFEKVGASVGLSNDVDNLYIVFRFNNHKWLPLLSRSGLTIWLDPLAKKKQDFGIRYFAILPVNSTPIEKMREQPSEKTSGQRPNLPQMHRRAVEEIIVFSDGKQLNSIPPNGSYGIAACTGNEGGIYTYELSIPLPDDDPLKYAIGANPGQDISIGFEITGMVRSDFQQMRSSKGGMSGRMPPGGGKGAGGGRGGGMGGQIPTMHQMPQGEKFWIKTTLTQKPDPVQISEKN